MKNKMIVSAAVTAALLFSAVCAAAMPTNNFDGGMAKGVDYFNQGLYYEARDEFQWFCDDNWGNMNYGQQQYALDYLNGAKQKIADWESRADIDEEQANSLVIAFMENHGWSGYRLSAQPYAQDNSYYYYNKVMWYNDGSLVPGYRLIGNINSVTVNKHSGEVIVYVLHND